MHLKKKAKKQYMAPFSSSPLFPNFPSYLYKNSDDHEPSHISKTIFFESNQMNHIIN